MKIEMLTNNRIKDFVEYCKKYRNELDDSYLCDEDLEKFEVNEENPTYILSDNNGQVIGAISLMIDDYNKKGKKARFRIMHSVTQQLAAYELMMSEIKSHTKGLDNVFLFVKEANTILANICENLSFKVERYAFLLERDAIDIKQSSFPQEYRLEAFQLGRDEEVWCEVRNAAFAKLAGHETPMTSDMVRKMVDSNSHLEGGMIILYHNENPVGVVRVSKEFDKEEIYSFIGPLAIKPEYQGKGFGKNLLREALRYGAIKGMPKAMLSVNGENSRARELYLKEGFKNLESVICYKYKL